MVIVMTGCSYPDCSEEESLPFKCRLCEQYYCAKHRLPEQHNCPRIAIYQTDEYKKSKVSPVSPKEEKVSKKKEKQKRFYSPRDIEQKSVYMEPKDKFLVRSSMFSLYIFRFNSVNMILGTLFVLMIMSLNTLVTLTIRNRGADIFTPQIFLFFFIGYLISVTIIYGGHMIIEDIYARKLGIRSSHALWIQGMILGIFSIFFPFLLLPNYLTFRDLGNTNTERGKVSLSGFLWILLWQIASLLLQILASANVVLPWPMFYLGMGILSMFFYIYLIFSLIPFGISHGRYIRSWNNKLFWYLVGSTAILFITNIIVMSI